MKKITYTIFFIFTCLSIYFLYHINDNNCYLQGEICVTYFDYSNTTEIQITKTRKNDNNHAYPLGKDDYVYPFGKDGFYIKFYNYSKNDFYVVFQEAINGFKCTRSLSVKKLNESEYRLILYKISRGENDLLAVDNKTLPNDIKKWFDSIRIDSNKEILCE